MRSAMISDPRSRKYNVGTKWTQLIALVFKNGTSDFGHELKSDHLKAHDAIHTICVKTKR